MFKKSLKLFSALLLWILHLPSVVAADIREDPHDDRVAVLEGVIVPGDFEKVSKFILSSVHTRIFLASPGAI